MFSGWPRWPRGRSRPWSTAGYGLIKAEITSYSLSLGTVRPSRKKVLRLTIEHDASPPLVAGMLCALARFTTDKFYGTFDVTAEEVAITTPSLLLGAGLAAFLIGVPLVAATPLVRAILQLNATRLVLILALCPFSFLVDPGRGHLAWVVMFPLVLGFWIWSADWAFGSGISSGLGGLSFCCCSMPFSSLPPRPATGRSTPWTPWCPGEELSSVER